MVSIIIVDTKKEFRQGIKNALRAIKECKVVGFGKDGYDAIRLADNHKPDIAILELELPFLDALKASQSIRLHSPATEIIILSKTNTEEMIIEMIKQRVAGCVSAGDDQERVFEEINSAVNEILKKGYYFSNDINEKALQILSNYLNNDNNVNNEVNQLLIDINPVLLSKIETKVLKHVGNGLSNREIAGELNLKEGTVRNYISTILNKTNLEHRAQAAIYSFILGYSDTGEFLKRMKKHKDELNNPPPDKQIKRRDLPELIFQPELF